MLYKKNYNTILIFHFTYTPAHCYTVKIGMKRIKLWPQKKPL